MYGMVNHGVQTFITENFGEDDWKDICAKAGLREKSFEPMLSYPDEVTYDLVGAISKKLDMSAQEVLERFGTYWVDYSKSTTVGQLLRFGGQGLVERLETLNAMHSRIKLSMPHLQPPHFEFEEGDNDVHKLHYFSDREGLEHMVLGLINGLAAETGDLVEVTQTPAPEVEGARATFVINVLKSAA